MRPSDNIRKRLLCFLLVWRDFLGIGARTCSVLFCIAQSLFLLAVIVCDALSER
jgi:hypothetical protein